MPIKSSQEPDSLYIHTYTQSMYGAINIHLWFIILVKDQQGKKGKVQNPVSSERTLSTQQAGKVEAHIPSMKWGRSTPLLISKLKAWQRQEHHGEGR